MFRKDEVASHQEGPASLMKRPLLHKVLLQAYAGQWGLLQDSPPVWVSEEKTQRVLDTYVDTLTGRGGSGPQTHWLCPGSAA